MRCVRLQAGRAMVLGWLLAGGCAALLAEPPRHHHPPGPHGGTVAEWSDGNRHVELTVDHDRQEATVHLLDARARGSAPIRATRLLLTIEEPPFQVELAPLPLAGEPKDSSSRFTGRHPNLGRKQEFAGTISDEVHRATFREEPEGHGH